MNKNLSILKKLGWIEGVSLLVLVGICVPLKYLNDLPEPNMIVGMFHGVIFVVYCIWVYIVYQELNKPLSFCVWALIASVLPFGTIVADKRLFVE